MRNSKQRRAIAACLEEGGRPLTAAELLVAARERIAGLGIATVYRALSALREDGTLTVVELPGEPTRFERSSPRHHHYFRCRRCGLLYVLHGCIHGLASWLPHGFVHERHEVVLYGKCSRCQYDHE